MKLIIVRHGETHHNRTNIHMGQLDVPLSDRGQEQAKLVGDRLATEHISEIYSSDLLRASVTAQKIASHHPHLQIHYDPLLRERHVGVLEGQPILPVDDIGNQAQKADRTRRPEQGESIHDVKVRATTWFEATKKKHMNDTILVIGHGLFLFVLLEVAVEDGADLDRQDFLLNNTSVTVLEVHLTGRAQIIHLNDTSHLQAVENSVDKTVDK